MLTNKPTVLAYNNIDIQKNQDKFGALKTAYTMMMGHPGKKLLFMGQDFGQEAEWDYKGSLQWYLCDDPGHRDILECYRRLLNLYTTHAVLYNDAGKKNTFEWINSGDYMRNLFSFIRRNPWNYNDALVFVINFAPVDRDPIEIGVPVSGEYKKIFSTYADEEEYSLTAVKEECDGRPYRLVVKLRPYESLIFSVPWHESTEEEKEEERKTRRRIKKEHEDAISDNEHVPKVPAPVEKPARTGRKKAAAATADAQAAPAEDAAPSAEAPKKSVKVAKAVKSRKAPAKKE